ncbi:DNA repair protein Rad60 [Schizosaccharomyces octosporus yFS286]|uniref:DNA repair protein Rad60 n=1 Tax=Schizosaccharomyces octosporus (strain yFS286) TaxID=483514 RepID=S9PX62_SCHOY|nr:DNA repair protein Rad60 [Schizosaccharomyces octosporus yFS286]EPX72572.1 DNA repair protein Rad60 [Schizosaccharomyces octosporus yFS286]
MQEDDDDLAFFTKPIKKPPLNVTKRLSHSLSDSDENSDQEPSFEMPPLKHIRSESKHPSRTSTLTSAETEPTASSTLLSAGSPRRHDGDPLRNKEGSIDLEHGLHPYATRAATSVIRSNSLNTVDTPPTPFLDDDFTKRLEELDRQVKEFRNVSKDQTESNANIRLRDISPSKNADTTATASGLRTHSLPQTDSSNLAPNEPLASPQIDHVPVILQLAIIGQKVPGSTTFLPSDWESPLLFKVKSNQQFRRVRDAYTARKRIQDVVFVFQNRKLWDFGTPKGAGMLKIDTRLVIHAYHKEDYELLQQQRAQEEAKLLSSEEPKEIPLKRIISILVRPKKGQDVRLSIPVNTSVEDIIRKYCNQTEISFHEGIRLEFEGDWLEPKDTLENLEIEDEDQISILL